MHRPSMVSALLLAVAAPLAAQDHAAHGGTPPATVGRVQMANSCAPAAQASFERGVALLHSFWFDESGVAFRAATQADPNCAMAWWGLASSYLHPLWPAPNPNEYREGRAAYERLAALRAPTHREGMYAAAISAYWDSSATVPHGQRLRRWSEALGQLHQAHADDNEATAFYALSLLAVANVSPADSTYRRQRQAGELLEPLFQRNPQHPGLAHYLIHAYDSPALAGSGTLAADRYAQIAPSVPHARHMPSHIYIRQGQWQRAVRSNASSAAASREHETRQNMDAAWDQRLHALDYMAYAYLQLGQDTRAREVVQTANNIVRYSPANSLTAEYALAAIPARFVLERGEWSRAAMLNMREGLQPQAAAVTHFARAIGAARSNDTATARTAVAALTRIEGNIDRAQQPIWYAMVSAQRMAAESWLLFARGDTTRALALAREAADLEDRSEKHPVTPGAILPARELLGDMLQASHMYAEAWAAYDIALTMQPRRARAIAGAATAARAAGDNAESLRYRRDLRALLAGADAARRAQLARN